MKEIPDDYRVSLKRALEVFDEYVESNEEFSAAELWDGIIKEVGQIINRLPFLWFHERLGALVKSGSFNYGEDKIYRRKNELKKSLVVFNPSRKALHPKIVNILERHVMSGVDFGYTPEGPCSFDAWLMRFTGVKNGKYTFLFAPVGEDEGEENQIGFLVFDENGNLIRAEYYR